MSRRGLSVLAALLLAAPLGAEPIEEYLSREMARRRIPGLAWAVAEHGAVTRQGALGLADVENGAAVTERSLFAIASLDKQLTAAGVLRAAELGQLALDDPLAKWVDVDFPGVTLRHLLAQASGLPDQVAGTIEGRYFTDYTSEQLLATVRGLVPMAPPGARFHYSDAGFFLAQLATEKAAGEPWWQFMRRELFAPAGMTTPLSLAPGALVAGRVLAYTLDAQGELVRDRRLDVDYGPLYSDLAMTAADFARWLAAQDGGRPLAAASVEAMITPVRLADGTAGGEPFQWSRYGLGVGLDDFLGESLVTHSGHSGVGFARFPGLGLSVVVFTNLEHPAGSDPVGLALGVAGLLRRELALAALPALAGEGAAEVEELYRGLVSGAPALDRYAPALAGGVWNDGTGLAGRAARWGALTRLELVAESEIDGERARLVRATHERATAYARFSFAADGRVSRLVWWHP